MQLTRTLKAPSDRTLNRMIIAAILVLAIGIPLVTVIYFLDRNVDPGPTLLQRQVAAAEEAVRTQPNDVGRRLVLATSYVAAGRLDDAIHQYDEILKVSPGHRVALLGKGDALAARGDLNGARALYQELVDEAKGGEFAGADPQLERAYYSLGSVAMKQDRVTDAVTALEAALKIDRADADAWYLLGAAQLKAGAADKAVQALRMAILFVPTGWSEPYAGLAQAYRALGRAAEAEYAAAMVDFSEKRPVEAKQRLEALTSGPVAVDAMLGLGMVAETEGDRDAASRWYQKVLALDPENFNAQVGLGRIGGGTPGGGHPSVAPRSPATQGQQLR